MKNPIFEFNYKQILKENISMHVFNYSISCYIIEAYKSDT